MCTSVSVVAIDGTHVLSRTMDWYDLYVDPIYVPRQYRWQSAYDGSEYINKYALVGSGFQEGNHIDISDGINERGLMAQKLTFANGANLVDNRNKNKIQLESYEFVSYILGNFSSIKEIEDHIDEIELMSSLNSNSKHGGAELHFSISDISGRNIVIEPSEHPMKIINNPLGVVTNMPKFEQQIDKLKAYMEFKPEFLQGNITNGTFHVTTGKLGGKKTPPGSYSPSQRFIRAAYLKELVDQPKNRDEATALAFGILDAVTVPKSKEHRPTYTVYRTATVAEDKVYYYQTSEHAQVYGIRLTKNLLENQKEPLVFKLENKWTPIMLEKKM